LQRHGIHLSRWQVQQTMKEEGRSLAPNWTQQIRERSQAQREYLHKPQAVNELWQLDPTPIWIEGYGRYQAINLVDYYSRYVLAAVLSPQQRAVDLIAVLQLAQQEAQQFHELPKEHSIVIVTDNGPALLSRKFAQYIAASPFRHVRGKEHHPQTIGMVERFHQSYKYEEVYLNQYRDPIEAAQALARYRWHYNWERPHQALACRVPAEVYCQRTDSDTKLKLPQKCLT
jgi:transposase InsO family protein